MLTLRIGLQKSDTRELLDPDKQNLDKAPSLHWSDVGVLLWLSDEVVANIALFNMGEEFAA